MKKPGSRGYVLILVSFIVPVMMMATKYVLDVSVENAVKSGTITKRCAREAALEVARHWNPALTFKQQKEAMYYIADQVYNSSPAYNSANSKYDAIPGLELPTKSSILSRGEFTPLSVKLSNFVGMSPSAKTIKYKEAKTNVNQYTISGYFDDGNSSQSGNEYYAPTIAVAYNELYNRLKSNRNPYSANDDLYINHAYYSNSSSYKDANNFSYNVVASNLQGLSTYSSQSTIGEQPYLTRENPDDTTVAIVVDTDQIQVVADDSVASAVPAECNVDIVLSIPVNGAACNQNNRDANTETSGKPYISTSKTIDSTTKSTPIYQIAQAYRAFLKENFFYTRGVNVGLIPYSGKLTLPSNRSSWTRNPRVFDEDIFLSKQNTNQAMLIGSMLYGSNGVKGGDLETLSKIPSSSCGIGIMCRGADVNYNGIAINGGDILSNVAPSNDNTKFQQMYVQPCYGGYANFLSMSCETNCIAHKINPFAILELTPDVQLIYEMLNVFHPYYDDKNNSNFVFLPVTWANNLFQSWTNDTQCNAINTLEDTTNYGRLSCPSKTTLERKKVLILIVNKPDWFEHEELTYLGFDNDFSEIPMFESDCIRGDIDYSDTSKKFADGSKYNGTIQGAKKILKLTGMNRISDSGYYEYSGTAKLSFPKKYLVKIVVEPGSGTKKAVQQTTYNAPDRVTDLCFYNNYFYAQSPEEGLFRSNDGKTWENLGKTEYISSSYYPCRLCYSNTEKVFLTIKSGNVYRGADVMSMSSVASSINADNLAGHDNIFIACSRQGNIYISTDTGKTWTDKGKKFSPISPGVYDFIYGNGKFIAFSWSEEPFISEDNGETWNRGSGLLHAIKSSAGNTWVFNSSAYGNGMFIAVNYEGGYIAYSNDGINWSRLTTEGTHISKGVTFGLNSFWLIDLYGKFYKLTGTNSEENIGIIKFSNISPQTNVTTNDQYQIKERREFYIEPHQITAGSDGNYYINIEMENIRLISAEITNRPYKKVIPSCSWSGTTSGTGKVVITTNCSKLLAIDATPYGKIQFYNDNGVSENVGTHTINGEKTFKFTGSDNFKSLSHRAKTLSNFSTSGGKNFGHNLSTQKLKYSLDNIKITNTELKNQLLRCYGHYNNGDGTEKTIITNSIGHAGNIYDSTAGKYVDPCIAASDTNYNNTEGWIWTTGSSKFAQVNSYNFHPMCYGVQKCKLIFTVGNIPAESVIAGDTEITFKGTSTTWAKVGFNLKNAGGNLYNVVDLTKLTSENADYVKLFMGRVKYITKKTYSGSRTNNDVVTATSSWGDCSGSSHKCVSSTSSHGNSVTSCYFCDTSWLCNNCCNWDNASRYWKASAAANWERISITEHGEENSTCLWGITYKATFKDNTVYTATETFDTAGNQLSTTKNKDITYNKVTSTETKIHRYDINNFFFLNTETKSLEGSVSSASDDNLKKNKGIYTLNNQWICFCGDGDLSLTVELEKPGTWKYEDDELNSYTEELTTKRTLTIDPKNYKHTYQNGLYTVEVNIDHLTLSNLRFSDSSLKNGGYIFEFEKPNLPKQSRVVDFSKNIGDLPEYQSSLIKKIDLRYIGYDTTRNCWLSQKNDYPYSEFYNNNIIGDFYFLIEDIGNIPPQIRFFNRSKGPEVYQNVKNELYLIPGLHRRYQYYNDIRRKEMASFDLPNSHLGGQVKYEFAGFTLPLNTMLYNGNWYSKNSLNTTEAVKNVTKAAIQKLKDDYGDNLRIYLIKYLQQQKYKHPVTESKINFDYNYLDSLAGPYIFEASDEKELKETLDAIAIDIKDWAKYTKAHVVGEKIK